MSEVNDPGNFQPSDEMVEFMARGKMVQFVGHRWSDEADEPVVVEGQP